MRPSRARRSGSLLVAALLLPLLVAGPASAQTDGVEPGGPVCTGDVPPALVVDRRDVPPVHRTEVDCAVFLRLALGRSPELGRRAFVPAEAVDRGAMASFLARTLSVAGVVLPPPDGEPFDDTRGSVHERAVLQLRAAGVVAGRTASTYEPQAPVTRGQTATLLLRAVALARGSAVDDLERDDSPFTDVEGSVHARAVAGAHALGLVRGVTADTYLPAAATVRAQMASLLVRMLEQEVRPVRRCVSVGDEYAVLLPAEWDVRPDGAGPACSAFDPVDASQDPAVLLRADAATYEELLSPGRDEVVVAEQTLLLGSRRAAVQERESRTDGSRRTLWFVDRGDRSLVGTAPHAGHDVATRGVLLRALLSLQLPEPDPQEFALPDTVDTAPSEGGRLGLVEVRAARHDGYDRVVLELDGEGTVGWRVAYTDDPRQQGSGDPVVVRGDAVLQVHLSGVGMPADTGVAPYDGPDRSDGPGTSVIEVVVGGQFEGRQGAFAGTSGKLPFRVFRLTGPERVVVDVAHPVP